MDNIGLYLTYADLMLEMRIAENSKVKITNLTLSLKDSSDVNGDKFNYAKENAGDDEPVVGGVLNQGGNVAHIISVVGGIVQIDIQNSIIINGVVENLYAASLPRTYAESLIEMSMADIDERTGQFFNKRQIEMQFEGRNTNVQHFPVPIIQVDELLINSTDTKLIEGEDYDFVVFNSRQLPDDRRNPRIKLSIGSSRGSIYQNSGITTRKFIKGALTKIIGLFGFLEPNGNTPPLIKRATLLLVMEQVNKPVAGNSSSSSGTGPLKRLKVDLHEKEFFESSSNKVDSRNGGTGNHEIDSIISRYHSPIKIGGSFQIERLDDYSAGNNRGII